jgi:hypothetical protein
MAPLRAITAVVTNMPAQFSPNEKLVAGTVIVFDVNETLLDFNVLAPVFARIFELHSIDDQVSL